MIYDIKLTVETEVETFHFVDRGEIEGFEGADIIDVKMKIAKDVRDSMELRDALIFVNESQNPVILQVKDIKSVEVVCNEVKDTD